MTDQRSEWESLHPNTRWLLRRREFLQTAATGAAATFLGFTVLGCSAAPASPATAPSTSTPTSGDPGSLYEQLGGAPALTAVVGTFLGNVSADTRINAFFANVNTANLQTQLVSQIGEATGGPEVYTGRSMKDAHAHLGIRMADFDALVEDLSNALTQYKVPEDRQQQLLGALAPMSADIVTR